MSEILNNLSDFSNIIPTDLSNYTDLLKENIELRSQKKELLKHIKKNEDLLFKAQKIINSLRDEMPSNENSKKSCSSSSDEKNILELQDKLYNSNKSLQETIIRANETSSQVKALNETNLKLERELHKTKKELEYSQQILKKLMNFYKKQEKSVDFSISKLIEENSYLKEQISENNSSSYSLLKRAENKIENLELNLSKIEENSQILPEIEQKISIYQRQTMQKFDLIEKTSDCISNQFEEVFNSYSCFSLEKTQESFKFFELNEKEIMKLDKNLLQLLKKLDFSQNLQNLLQLITKEVMMNIEKTLEMKFIEVFSLFEQKINKVCNFLSIIEMKREMKKEFLEKKLVSKPKSQEDYKNSTFGKNLGFFIDDDKENMNSCNSYKNHDKNFIDNFLNKLDEYKVIFQKFSEDISLIMKGINLNKSLKLDEIKFLRLAIDGRVEMAKDLEKFIINMSKNVDAMKGGFTHAFKDSKHLPLRI